jgi:putative nucleotidyltransferase with HDIG domain
MPTAGWTESEPPMSIYKWLKPPLYEDAEKNRVANLMNLILLFNGAFIILLLAGFILFGLTEVRYIVPVAAALILYGLFYAILRRGFVHFSAFLFVVSSYLLFMIVTVIYGGIRAPQLFLFFTTLVIASAVFREIPALAAYLLVMVSAIGIYLMERAGWMPDIYQPNLEFAPLIILGTNLVIMGGVIFLSNRNFRQTLALYKHELETRKKAEREVSKMNSVLEKAYQTTLEGWSRALELKDKETEGHCRRVAELTIRAAKVFGFTDQAIKYVYYGVLLHDIGKMGIPDEILKKHGELTAKERTIIRQHPRLALEMLRDIDYLQPAVSIPYSHHENWDGTGYPQGLRGEAIPLSARIFSVVDNWDALTSDRSYRDAWSVEKTIGYIKEQSGKKFDPQVVDVFLRQVIGMNELLPDAV